MRKVLSRKEFCFLSELREILFKYDATIRCLQDQKIEVLVFEKIDDKSDEDPIPVEFLRCLEETDIDELFLKNSKAMKTLVAESGNGFYHFEKETVRQEGE